MSTNKSGSLLYSPSGDKDQDEILLQPYNYMTKVPGFNITMKLCKAFNHWLNIPEEKMKQIDHIAFTLLNASLILDDIQDNSTLRKGIPAAHMIYGLGNTVNAGCYAAFVALEKSFELGHPDAPRIVVEQILITQRGQGIEIYWRDNTCPTEEEYMDMAMKKTALFTIIMKLMQLFTEKKQDHTKISAMLGMYMQIYDDYKSLFSNEYMDKKSYGEDLTEGKFSFPVMHAIHKYPDDKRVMNILKKRTTDKEVKKYCISLLEEYGSREYTQKKLVDLGNEIRKEMKQLGDNPYIEHLLNSTQS